MTSEVQPWLEYIVCGWDFRDDFLALDNLEQTPPVIVVDELDKAGIMSFGFDINPIFIEQPLSRQKTNHLTNHLPMLWRRELSWALACHFLSIKFEGRICGGESESGLGLSSQGRAQGFSDPCDNLALPFNLCRLWALLLTTWRPKRFQDRIMPFSFVSIGFLCWIWIGQKLLSCFTCDMFCGMSIMLAGPSLKRSWSSANLGSQEDSDVSKAKYH